MSAEQAKRVLVVDDDPDTRHLLVSILGARGLGVDVAADGDEALGALRENRYALILLDLLMPGTDGFAVLKALHAQDVIAPAVVLVVTGADRGVIDALDSHVIHGIVRKPFDADELASLVVACVEIKGRGTFETMAIATVLSSAQILTWLHRF